MLTAISRQVRFVIAAAAAALFGASVLAGSPASAENGELTGLFGTVVQIGPGLLSLGTDDGVVDLLIDPSTTFTLGDQLATLSDVREGDRVATAAFATPDGPYVASSLLVRPQAAAQTRHFVGVVLEVANGQVLIVDRDGRSISLDLPAQVRPPGTGEAVTIVAKIDDLTNRLVISATESQEQTIARLEASLEQLALTDASASQGKIDELRALIEENGRRHLTALQTALSRVEADGQEEIRANLLRLHSLYSEVAGRLGREAPGVRLVGTVSRLAGDRITVTDRDGQINTFAITSMTRYAVDEETRRSLIGPVEAISLTTGATVSVEFNPADATAVPAATRITIKQPELSSEVVDTLVASESRRFVGVITRVDAVEDLDSATGVVILTTEGDSRTVVLKTDAATDIAVNGEGTALASLVPGLGASIELDAQSLTAARIDAFQRVEREQHVRGVVKRIDLQNRVVTITPEKGSTVVVSVADGFSLEKDGLSTRLEGLAAGDLVLNASRVDVESGQAANLVVSSPRVPLTGIVRGVDRESHSITVESPEGDQVRVFVLAGTEFSGSAALRNSFNDVRVGDVVRQGELRITNVQSATRNVADLLVIQPVKLARAEGTVVGVDEEGRKLFVETSSGEVLALALPSAEQRVKLVKDDLPIDSLAPVNVGDVLGLVVYVEDTETIVSASLVTAGARGDQGRIASVAPRTGLIILTTQFQERLALQVTGDSRLLRNSRETDRTLFNTGDVVTRVLYVPEFDSGPGIDGRIILLEAIGRDNVPPAVVSIHSDAVSNLLQAEFRLSGTIQLVSGDRWRIDGREFLIVDKTDITGTLEDGAVGTVTVRGARNGTLEAQAVRIAAAAPHPR